MPDVRTTTSRINLAGGTLFVEDGDRLIQFLPWPALCAYERRGNAGRWLPCAPEFAIPPDAPMPDEGGRLREDEADALEIVAAYCSPIPAGIRRMVAQFPERQWDVLRWAARTGQPAADLLGSNPVLAFALACGAPRARGRRHAALLTEVHYLLPLRRQAQTLVRLGFPGTERVRKILRKIEPRAITAARLDRLRQWLADEQVADHCARLPSIDLSVMALFDRGQIRRASFDRLLQIARGDQQRTADTALRMRADALRVWGPRAAQAEGRDHPRPGAARMAMSRPQPKPRWADFPPTPVPGTPTIIPILTRAELRDEGRLQDNCVASLAARAVKSELAFYKVLYPQRCTLSLKPTPAGWVIDQLEAAHNRAALPATFRAVGEWLALDRGRKAASG